MTATLDRAHVESRLAARLRDAGYHVDARELAHRLDAMPDVAADDAHAAVAWLAHGCALDDLNGYEWRRVRRAALSSQGDMP